MNSKMYASLEDYIQKWIDKWADTQEWEQLNFWCPDELNILLSQVTANTFDAIVKSSQEAEENTKS